ncbi:DUF3363 domain-containing protein [Hyphococcus sp.]|uniref:DUF3363 domain-containing protein n=1 Tax=Hyphococcus sp. TaxID=2038636 RepID=UPI003CCBD3F9
MTGGEYDFTPRLGRIRNKGARSGQTEVQKLIRVASGPRAKKRIRRGATSPAAGGRYGRRSIVKTRIVKMAGTGAAKQRAHLRYIERDAARGKETGKAHGGALYDRETGEADRDAFLERGKGDRHQFRIILSPEDGGDLESLKPLIRDLMASMERDLETRLDWIAADHYDTGRPHTHIVIRGRREDGADLIIPKRIIAYEMRVRANELLTIELGPVTERELQQRIGREVGQERWTSLDRDLAAMERDGSVEVEKDSRHLKSRLHLLRLEKLQRLGLADKVEGRRWRLAAGWQEKLRDLGLKGDIVKGMNRALRSRGDERTLGAEALFDPVKEEGKFVGRVIETGRHGDFHERAFAVIDSIDGSVRHVDLGEAEETDEIKRGVIIEVSGRGDGIKKADRVIADIARRNNGVYSPERHAESDPNASREFIRAHVRRLEALRRLGVVDRSGDGSWEIPDDYEARIRRAHRGLLSKSPVEARILTTWTLADQTEALGAGWIDREAVEHGAGRLSDEGFGGEVRKAMERRREFLLARGLVNEREVASIDRVLLSRLEAMELSAAGESLSAEFGKPFVDAPKSGKIEGRYVRNIELASGRYAIIEKRRELTLVTLRRGMERALGRQVFRIARSGRVTWDWTKGKGR